MKKEDDAELARLVQLGEVLLNTIPNVSRLDGENSGLEGCYWCKDVADWTRLILESKKCGKQLQDSISWLGSCFSEGQDTRFLYDSLVKSSIDRLEFIENKLKKNRKTLSEDVISEFYDVAYNNDLNIRREFNRRNKVKDRFGPWVKKSYIEVMKNPYSFHHWALWEIQKGGRVLRHPVSQCIITQLMRFQEAIWAMLLDLKAVCPQDDEVKKLDRDNNPKEKEWDGDFMLLRVDPVLGADGLSAVWYRLIANRILALGLGSVDLDMLLGADFPDSSAREVICHLSVESRRSDLAKKKPSVGYIRYIRNVLNYALYGLKSGDMFIKPLLPPSDEIETENQTAPTSLRTVADAWGGDMTPRKLRQLIDDGQYKCHCMGRQLFVFDKNEIPRNVADQLK